MHIITASWIYNYLHAKEKLMKQKIVEQMNNAGPQSLRVGTDAPSFNSSHRFSVLIRSQQIIICHEILRNTLETQTLLQHL
jgi:hypothetical protein